MIYYEVFQFEKKIFKNWINSNSFIIKNNQFFAICFPRIFYTNDHQLIKISNYIVNRKR